MDLIAVFIAIIFFVIVVLGTVMWIIDRACERGSMSDRDKAYEIFRTREMAANLKLLMSEIRNENYYGTLNSCVKKRDSQYNLHIYSFLFSGSPVSITEYYRFDFFKPEKIDIVINNQCFLVFSEGYDPLKEYHHDWNSQNILEKIFADIRQNCMSRQLEAKNFRDAAEKKKFTFKRN